MGWEVLALWLIVAGTVIWFIRDEKRLRAEADIERAARYYAHAPKYRHAPRLPAEEAVPPVRRSVGGLSPEQRAFMQALLDARPTTQD